MKGFLVAAALLGCLVVMLAAETQEVPPPPGAGPVVAPRVESPQGGPGFRPLHRRWRGEGPGDGTRELLEQVMIARLSQELALDDEQTVLLVRRYTVFRDQVRELNRQRNDLIRDLKAAVKEGTDGAAIEAKLDAVIAHDQKILEAKREVYELAGAELTEWQRAKLYLFMVEFEADMRRLLTQARERYGRAAEGPPLAAEEQGPLRRKQGAPGAGRQGKRLPPGQPPEASEPDQAPVAPPPEQ